MSTVDYELLYCCMEHPSKDVLRAGQKHIKEFPDVYISGKQPNHPFTHNEMCAKNLNSFPMESHHKFKYTIIFYDDYTSMG